jgi:NADH dehydrogenase/NADH:ubiquinone oxidoreductase subunit G
MGALTLKTFPFELRGWEVEKFKFIDLSDSFGSSVRISINNKKIIQIEPVYNNSKSINWLNDKGRQFFDSLVLNCNSKIQNEAILNILKIIYNNIYLVELCNLKINFFTHYFIILYENLNNNMLYLLLILSKRYSFITLKKPEIRKLPNNLQTNFLINKNFESHFLKISSFCMLISNVRFESSILNLNLKQRHLKGNFKCFIVGSFLNITYDLNYLGKTTFNFFKNFVEGLHFICQDLKTAINPILILNTEIFKRNDSINFLRMLNILNFSLQNKLKINILNLSIFEVGNFYFKKPEILKVKNLSNLSCLYFINLTTYSFLKINRLLILNILFYNFNKSFFIVKRSCINQNFYDIETFNKKQLLKKFDNYLYIPTKSIFENKNIFINTQGLIKSTSNLILNTKKKPSWKFIRKIISQLNKKIKFINLTNHLKISINLKNKTVNVFSNLIFKTTNKLCKNSIICHLNFVFFNFITILKTKKNKYFNSKLKFWLNDFFTSGKDDFSKNSMTMIKCSSLQRLERTNFF